MLSKIATLATLTSLTALTLGVGQSSALTDITFFAISDVHFGQSNTNSDKNRNEMPGHLNNLPGKLYPASVGGGPIGTPRGVLMPGDLIDWPDTTLWRQYLADYGPSGGRVKFPVYDGLGNHEFFNYETNKASFMMKDHFLRRNSQRKGITAFDSTGLHYSWDWDQVHFVQLNLFAGNQIGAEAQWDPFKSLDFLKKDLEKNVGQSGRPVIVLQHLPYSTAEDYYQNVQKAATIQVLKNYNCIGLMHGHTHSPRIYKYQGVDVFDDGTAMSGHILVFRIMDGRMYVVDRVGGSAGTIAFEKTINMGTPVNLKRGKTSEALGKGFTFSVEGLGKIYSGNKPVYRVEISDFRGRVVRSLHVTEASVTWDAKDSNGRTLQQGLYVVNLFNTSGRVASLKTLIRSAKVH